MNKRYILMTMVFGMMLATFTTKTLAQVSSQNAADSTIVDITGRSEVVPGRLFNVTKENSTGAVSTVYGSTLYKTSTPNLTNTLYGRLSGLTVLSGSGEPGNDNALLGIRGVGSFSMLANNGLNSYKLFVDGFETNANYFSNLSPAEIETVSVLKDAASLATFGMKGANGVIYVTTKRGHIGKSIIQFQIRTGQQSAVNINEPLDAYGYANLYNQARSNDNGNVWSPLYSLVQLDNYRNGSSPNVNWYAEVLKKQAPYSDADLTFAGGDSTARYHVVLNYANQQALYDVKNSDATSNQTFKRYNLRSNLDFKLFGIFEAKVDLGGRIEDRRSPNYPVNGLWQNLTRYPANIYQVKDEATGNWSGTTLYPDNPVASINALGWNSSHRRVLQGNFSLTERLNGITPGLYLSQAFSFNSWSQGNYNKTSDYPRFFNGAPGGPTNQLSPLRASGLAASGQEDWKQLMGTLGYERSFGSHQLLAALNFHQSDFKGDGGVTNYVYHYQNFSGRANYSYDNRYVGEFGFSYFGADAYTPGNRWGFYPAVSAGWIVSNESFLKENSFVNLLKLRASVGKSGGMDSEVQNGGRFLFKQYYNNNGNFLTGNASVTGSSGLSQTLLANPDVFAETSLKYNVGTDIKLMKKLDITLDVFIDKRSDILAADNTLSAMYGSVFRVANLGKVTNRGAEVLVVFSDRIGQFGYSVSGMAALNSNKLNYMAELPQVYEYNQQTGRSLFTPIGHIATGFYQLDDFNADQSLKSGIAEPAFGAVQPGDLRYQDLNGDDIVDERDVTNIGKPLFPRLSYSFGTNLNWKGLDLGALFQGISGASVNILGPATQAFVGNGNAFSIAEGAWAYYPNEGIDTRTTATYPRLTTAANSNNYGRQSSFWQKSRDFLRLRNIELGYTFAPSLIGRLGMRNLRIFVNAINPVSWSSLQRDYNMDPETLDGYPILKSYNTGLSVTF